MNQSGPVPLITHMKYFTGRGNSANASIGAPRELNHPMKTPKKNNPMVEGTRSFVVLLLNHSFAGRFSRAYLALIPARMNSSGMNQG